MKNLITFTILAITLGLVSACNQQAPLTTIGVINLGKVSDETGNAEKIQSELAKIRARLQSNLQAVQMNLQKNFQDNQLKIGKTPTDQQRVQLGKMLADAQNKLKQAQNSAAIELKNKQEELVINFRNTIRPISNKIAQQQGMNVVLIQNDNVILGFDKKVDITDAVIAELKKLKKDKDSTSKKPATPAAKMPALETPAAKMPALETPAAKMPATETPAAKMPATETPAAKMPATETPKK